MKLREWGDAGKEGRVLGGNDVNTSLSYEIIKNKINESERLEIVLKTRMWL